MNDEKNNQQDDPWVAPPLDSSQAQQWTQPLPAQPAPSQPDASGYAAPPTGQPYGSDPYAAQGYAAPGQGYAAPYGAAPYGTPQGYAQPPRTDKDWMGIASLVTSLIGISLVGVILGHLGLRANKNGEASNRGIALAGTIIGWLGIIGTVLFVGFFIVVAIATSDDSTWEYDGASDYTVEDPYVEDPFTEDEPTWTDDLAEAGDGVFTQLEADTYFVIWVDGDPTFGTCLSPSATVGYDLDVVSCEQAHVGEIFVSKSMSELIVADDPWSDESWDAYYAACDAGFVSALGEDAYLTSLYWWVFAASDDTEPSADDSLLCVLSEDFTESTGSVLENAGVTDGQNL